MLSYVGPWGITSDYGGNGWFHVYAFTMLFGMALAIFASWYKLRRYQIPADGLALSVIFIIPASLLGASWFGKNDPLNPIGFWQQFAFWKPGLSIHGGVLFGAIVGLIYFAIYKRKTKISLFTYADCIIPNILLGQVIGRWGNFFNHELLGQIVGYSPNLDASSIPALNWLPAFIRDNCFKVIYDTPEMVNGMYVFRVPIFLYESLANLGCWVLITFALPKGFRWFSKKPWKVEANKYKLLTFNNLLSDKVTKTKKTITNKQKDFNDRATFFFSAGKSNQTDLEVKASNEAKTNNFGQRFNFIVRNPFKLLNLSLSLSSRNMKLKRKYWREAFYDYKVDAFTVKKLNQEYQTKKQDISKSEIKKIAKIHLTNKAYYHRSKELYYLNNPQKYSVMRSGVQMWLYFFGYNLIRFCFELQRADDNLFILNRRALDYVVLILIFTLALFFVALNQFVFSKYNRSSGWTYEKQY